MRLLQSTVRIRIAVFVAALALVIGVPLTAHAVSWTNFYKSPSSGVSNNLWKSTTVPGQARYNRASAHTYQSGSANAWVHVGAVGSASAPWNVYTSFAYQGGTFKCKWTWSGGFGKGPLTCRLGWG